MHTYIGKVNVFIKQATYEYNTSVEEEVFRLVNPVYGMHTYILDSRAS